MIGRANAANTTMPNCHRPADFYRPTHQVGLGQVCQPRLLGRADRRRLDRTATSPTHLSNKLVNTRGGSVPSLASCAVVGNLVRWNPVEGIFDADVRSFSRTRSSGSFGCCGLSCFGSVFVRHDDPRCVRRSGWSDPLHQSRTPLLVRRTGSSEFSRVCRHGVGHAFRVVGGDWVAG